jgi:hypothetical protein
MILARYDSSLARFHADPQEDSGECIATEEVTAPSVSLYLRVYQGYGMENSHIDNPDPVKG